MVKPRFSNIEYVSPLASPLSPYLPSFGGRVQLQSQDRVLVDNGGSGYRALDIYLSLFVNPVVYKSWEKLLSEITAREWEVKPFDDSDESRMTADFLRSQVDNFGQSSTNNPLLPTMGGMDELTRALGVAKITGISCVELVWGRDNEGRRIVQYFKPRDPRLFKMEYDDQAKITRPRLITKDDYWRGKAIPAHKFIFHRYWTVPNDDEYGSGMGRNLYYCVEWHKMLMSFWLMLVDKTVMPSTIGKWDNTAQPTPEDVEEFKEAVRNLGQDSAMVLPPGFSVDTLLINGDPSMVEKLIDKVDTYIETLIVGESSTGKEGGGSMARDNVAEGIRVSAAKTLSDSICMTLNQTYVKWLIRANFGFDAPLPTLWRTFEESVKVPSTLAEVESISEWIDLASKLKQMGVNLDNDYVAQRLDVPLMKKKPALYGGNIPSPDELLGG